MIKFKPADSFPPALSLRDIHVGDWVQVCTSVYQPLSSPMRVVSIHENGLVQLITEGAHSTQHEEHISRLRALPITPELLDMLCFFFVSRKRIWNGYYHRDVYFKQPDNTDVYIGEIKWEIGSFDPYILTPKFSRIRYLHELISYMHEKHLHTNLSFKPTDDANR